jgi:ribosomal protein S18 acetylase RimI-like enzyme
MAKITCRAAHKSDAAAIAAIHVASWRDAYRSIFEPDFLAGPVEEDRFSLWTKRLSDPPPNLVVKVAIGSDHRAVGFVAAYQDQDPWWGSMVDNLHVVPGVRGRGIGETLLRAVARHLEAQGARGGLHLGVFELNDAGLRFYQRLGGQVAERLASRIPAAGGKTVLRVHWPVLARLSQSE